MKSLWHHVERARERPEHIRKQIAFTAAAVITGVVAFSWLGVSAATGSFALKNSSFADATSGAAPAVVAQKNSGFSNLLGAAGAVFSGGDKGPAHIEVIDPNAAPADAKPAAKASEPTVLPF